MKPARSPRQELTISNVFLPGGTERVSIRIQGAKIEEVSYQAYPESDRSERFDGQGALVLPGFVDPHSHADRRCEEPTLSTAKAAQGIMVEVVGNCGLGPSPAPSEPSEWEDQLSGLGILTRERYTNFGGYLGALASQNIDISPEVSSLVPYGAVRTAVAGLEEHLTNSQLFEIQELIRSSLADGGLGVSLGLVYPPNQWADSAELHTTLRALHSSPTRLLATHIRSQSSNWMRAIGEVLDLARGLNLRLLISHLCVGGTANWWKTEWVVERLNTERERGLDVWFDHHPYTAGATSFLQLLPPNAMPMLSSATRPALKKMLKGLGQQSHEGWDNYISLLEPSNILITNAPDAPELVGKTLRDLMEQADGLIEEVLFDVLDATGGRAGIVLMNLYSAEAVRYLSTVPFGCFSTDSVHVPLPHPRLAGTFPYAYSELVRTGTIDDLEFAQRSSWRTSQVLGIPPTSTLQPGSDANFLLIDTSAFGHKPDYQEPMKESVSGMRATVVNGRLAAHESKPF